MCHNNVFTNLSNLSLFSKGKLVLTLITVGISVTFCSLFVSIIAERWTATQRLSYSNQLIVLPTMDSKQLIRPWRLQFPPIVACLLDNYIALSLCRCALLFNISPPLPLLCPSSAAAAPPPPGHGVERCCVLRPLLVVVINYAQLKLTTDSIVTVTYQPPTDDGCPFQRQQLCYGVTRVAVWMVENEKNRH